MKASEVIAKLTELIEEHGDDEVSLVTNDGESDHVHPVDCFDHDVYEIDGPGFIEIVGGEEI